MSKCKHCGYEDILGPIQENPEQSKSAFYWKKLNDHEIFCPKCGKQGVWVTNAIYGVGCTCNWCRYCFTIKYDYEQIIYDLLDGKQKTFETSDIFKKRVVSNVYFDVASRLSQVKKNNIPIDVFIDYLSQRLKEEE